MHGPCSAPGWVCPFDLCPGRQLACHAAAYCVLVAWCQLVAQFLSSGAVCLLMEVAHSCHCSKAEQLQDSQIGHVLGRAMAPGCAIRLTWLLATGRADSGRVQGACRAGQPAGQPPGAQPAQAPWQGRRGRAGRALAECRCAANASQGHGLLPCWHVASSVCQHPAVPARPLTGRRPLSHAGCAQRLRGAGRPSSRAARRQRRPRRPGSAQRTTRTPSTSSPWPAGTCTSACRRSWCCPCCAPPSAPQACCPARLAADAACQLTALARLHVWQASP